MNPLPIRVRLAAAFSVGLLVVLVVAGAFVYLRVGDELSRALDASLGARADDIATLVQGSTPAEVDLGGIRAGEGESSFTQLLDSRGHLIQSTLPASDQVLNREQVNLARAEEVRLDGIQVVGIEGESRVVAVPVDTERQTAIAVVGATTSDREEALDGILKAFALGAPFALVLASGLGYLLGGRSLAPVDAMRARAQELSFDGAEERLPTPQAKDELRKLAETLNAMLERVEMALQRERVFVSDASHELRSPLAILKSEIDLVRRTGGTKEELEAALDSAAEEVDQLVRLAEDLLVIARADQGRLPIRREPVDICALLKRVRSRRAESSRQAGLNVVVGADGVGSFEVDPLRVEQALDNLLDNAIRHGAGTVRLDAERSSQDELVLTVSDEGLGFPPGLEAEAFERFTQASGARSDSGAGLGLAIVRAIATAHEGVATIVRDPSAGAMVRMVLPRGDSTRPF